MSDVPRPLADARLIGWAAAVGVLSGAAAVAFRYLATLLPRLIWAGGPDLVHAVSIAPWWLCIAAPVGGALLAGLVLTLGRSWSGAARGWDILEAVVVRDGVLHLRPALIKSLSSLVTTASGGAIGREGPMVLLAATMSSLTGRRLGVPTRKLRVLVGCGVAAGIACAYNTPIGAALFTMEIIIGNFAMAVFAPLVFASVIPTLIARAVFRGLPVFAIPDLAMASSCSCAAAIPGAGRRG
jgi:CIC family chloride channel protein